MLMRTATKLLTTIHGLAVFSLFAGMLFIAGISLISLSPIGYEEYAQYKAGLTEAQANSNPSSSVAGAETEFTSGSVDLERSKNRLNYINLLEQTKYSYKVIDTKDTISMDLSVGPTLQEQTTVKVIEMINTSNAVQYFQANFANLSSESFAAGLMTDIADNRGNITAQANTSEVSYLTELSTTQSLYSYDFSLLPGQRAKVKLLFQKNIGVEASVDLNIAFNIAEKSESDVQIAPGDLKKLP